MEVLLTRKMSSVIGLGCALFCLSIIVVTVILEPSPNMHATHRSLGLPGCLTSRLLNIDRCPSCGLTTAFCLIGKGRIREAAALQPWSLPFYGLLLLGLASSPVASLRKDLRLLALPVIAALLLGSAYLCYWVRALLELRAAL